MDDHRLVLVEVHHANLEQRSVARGTDEHGDLDDLELPDVVAEGVLHVVVGDAVLTSRWGDSHLDRIPCLKPLSSALTAADDWAPAHSWCPNPAESVPNRAKYEALGSTESPGNTGGPGNLGLAQDVRRSGRSQVQILPGALRKAQLIAGFFHALVSAVRRQRCPGACLLPVVANTTSGRRWQRPAPGTTLRRFQQQWSDGAMDLWAKRQERSRRLRRDTRVRFVALPQRASQSRSARLIIVLPSRPLPADHDSSA